MAVNPLQRLDSLEVIDLRDELRGKIIMLSAAAQRLERLQVNSPDFEIWAGECRRLIDDARALHTKLSLMVVV